MDTSTPPSPRFSQQLSSIKREGFGATKELLINETPGKKPPQLSIWSPNNRNPQSEVKEKKQPRPPNSWILYRSDKIVEMKSLHHGLAQSLLSKEIATRWHNESHEVKDAYARKAEIFKAEHAIKYPDYKYSPKRKKLIENKKGDQNKAVKLASSPAKPKSRPSNDQGPGPTKRPNTPPNSSGILTGMNSSPQRNERIEQVISPEKLEADLYSSYPILSHLVAAQEFQPEQGVLESDYIKEGHSTTIPSLDNQLSQGFLEQTDGGVDLWRPQEIDSQQFQLFHTESNDVQVQSLPPVTQPPSQIQWMDFSQLDPQLHFDNNNNRIQSTSVGNLTDWMNETETDSHSIPTTSTLSLTDHHQHSSITPHFSLFAFPSHSLVDFNSNNKPHSSSILDLASGGGSGDPQFNTLLDQTQPNIFLNQPPSTQSLNTLNFTH